MCCVCLVCVDVVCVGVGVWGGVVLCFEGVFAVF